MQQQIADFLTSLQEEKGYSNNTVVAYRNDLGQFVQFLGEQPGVSGWQSVTQENLAAYIDCLKWEREYASATVARKVAAAKSFFHYLVGLGVIGVDPSENLDSPKVHKYLPNAISKEEVERLLRAPAKHDTSRGIRDAALLEVLYATGMRVSELVALDVTDIDLQRGTVHCASRSSKIRERTIPLFERASAALRAYVGDSRPRLVRDEAETALFLNHRGRRLTRQGLWLIIKKYVEEAGIESVVTPHTLRHSFATHLLDGGAKVHEVQGLLGHANVSTTRVYKQVSQEQALEEDPSRAE